MLRKRFIALVMALTMLFTLMAPAFTFALDDGETPDQTPASDAAGDTNEQPPAADPDEGGDETPGEDGASQGEGDPNQGGEADLTQGEGEGGEGDADKGGDQGNGDANVGAGDQGNGDANVGDGETLSPATVPNDGEGDGEGEPLRETPTTRSTLTEGWYLIGINGRTVNDLTENDRFPDPVDGVSTLIRDLNENDRFKAIYVQVNNGDPELDETSWFPADNDVKPGPAGRYYIYFHDDYNNPGNKWLRATPLQDEHYYYIGSDIDWEEPRAVELENDLSISRTFNAATEFKIIKCHDHGLLTGYPEGTNNNVRVEEAGTYIIRRNDDNQVTATQVYTLTTAVSPADSGTLVASKNAAAEGDQITLTITPAAGYRYDKLVMNGADLSASLDENNQTIITMPGADATVTAYFAAIKYVIETDANIAHGSVFAFLNEATVGQEVTLTVTPEEGYQVSEVKYNDTVIDPLGGGYSFTMPAANATVTATFTLKPGIVTYDDQGRIKVDNQYVATVTQLATGLDTVDGKTLDAEYVFNFTSGVDIDEGEISGYKTWNCDYFVSFNQAISKGDVVFFEKYGDYQATTISSAFAAGQQIPLVSNLLQKSVTLADLKSAVAPFTCGVYNNRAPEGTIMTVELRMTDPANQNEYRTVQITTCSLVSPHNSPITLTDDTLTYLVANIPMSQFVNAANAEGDKTLKVEGNAGTVIFNEAAVAAIAGKDNESALTLSVLVSNGENGAKIYDITLVDANNVNAFSGGEGQLAIVTVPYEVTDGNVPAVYLVVNGVKTLIPSVYDPNTKTVTFEAPHFSTYEVRTVVTEASYTFEANGKVALSAIMESCGLSGEVTAVENKGSTSLLTVAQTDGVWNVTALKPFSSTEDIVVTLDGTECTIHVTNAAAKTVWTELVDRNAPASDYAVIDETNKTVTVSDARGLAWVAYMTNTSGETDWNTWQWFAGWTVQLGADIDLSGYLWAPIGNSNTFDGTFNGCGHTISNLRQNVYEQQKDYVGTAWSVGGANGTGPFGLFGYFTGVAVRNLTIDGANVFSEGGAIGVVAGYAYDNAVFENITVKNSHLNGCSRGVGCIVGYATGWQVTDAVMTFSHITVDSSNVLNPVYYAADTPFGGILGNQGVPSSGTFKTKYEHCSISAEIMQLNDCVMCYDYWKYRDAGMLIGLISGVEPGADHFDASKYIIIGENVNVTYKDWNQGRYCEFRDLGTRNNHVRIDGPDYHSWAATYERDGHTIVIADLDQHYHREGEDHDILLVFDQLIGARTGGKGVRHIQGVHITYYNTVNVNQYPIWTWSEDGKAVAQFDAEGTITVVDANPVDQNGKKVATVYYDGDRYIATLDLVTVTYNTNGGSEIPARQVVAGQTIDAPTTNPDREHYTFVRWCSDEALTTEFDFTQPITEDVTVYAKWLGDLATVIYMNYNGSILKMIRTRFGEATPEFTPDPLPEREGYTLRKDDLWMPELAEKVESETVIYQLNWKKQHTVTFDSDGGSAVNAQQVEDGALATKPADPTKEGYTFLGWLDGNNEFNFDTKKIYEDYTLKAHWQINQYTVTFKDGDTVLQTTTADYGTPITAPTDPTKDGYIFMGWDIDVPATIPAGDLTINAVWALGVAKIGDTLYASLADAVAAAQSGDTIEMINDAVVASSIEFTGKKVTLDLAGKNVTSDADDTIHVLAGGELVFSDSVGTGSFTTNNNTAINNEGTTTIESGAIKATNGYGGPTIYNAGTLTVNDGSITAEGNYLNALNADGENSKTVINGGTITMTGNDGAAVIATGGATVEIKGGTIVADGNQTAVLQIGFTDSGNFVVTGGTLWAKGDGEVAIVLVYGEGTATLSDNVKEFNDSTNAETGLFTKLSGTGTLEITGGFYQDDPTEYVDLSKYTVIETTMDGREGYTLGEAVAVRIFTENGEEKIIGYASLEAAVAAAVDGDTVKLLKDAAGNGIKAPEGKFNTNGLTIDFGGFKYTMDGAMVGSTGTETQAFQLLKDNKITFKNGTLYSEKALFLVQNYSDLTLEGMTLTLNNPNYVYAYTLSNNNGSVVIKDTTINANPAGKFAFDVCRYASYSSVHVTATGNSVINGDIEISASGNDAKDGFGLMLEGGTFNGKIVLDASVENALAESPDKAWVKRAESVEVEIPDGYAWKLIDSENKIYLLVKAVAKIERDGKTLYFASLKDAVEAAQNGETIVMIADERIDVTGFAVTVPASKNVVLDLNGHEVIGQCSSGGTSALIRNLGTLTINDSSDPSTGKLIGGADPTWTWDGSDDYSGSYASNLIRNEGTLVVDGGYLYNASSGSAAYAIDNYGSGKVTVNGGTIDAKKASAIRMFYCNGGEITVNDGTIGRYISDDDCCYMGIQVMAGTNAVVNVNGGTIAGYYALYSNGTGSSAVQITGGTFDGYVGFAASLSNIVISSGKFMEWVGTYGDQTGFITGGLFAVAPDFEYCGKDEEGNQLYPIPNTDPETKEAYPYTVGIAVAKIGDVYYTTLEAAFADAIDGDTIVVLRDSAGNGIKVPQGKFTTGLTVDFDGHSYEIDGSLVGSTGTQTQAFQLLMDNNITFKNGTISSEKAYMLIQNYSSLTLENMTLDGSKLVGSAPYTLSNNNGTIVIDGSEIIAKDGGFAFDVCRYASYKSVNVTVKGDSVINGNIEVYASDKDAKDGFGLMLENGTFTGAIVLDASVEDLLTNPPEKAWVKRDKTKVEIEIPAGYTWVDLEGNIQLLVKLMTVTFDADNGTEKVTVEVPKGQKVERPSDPVKDHYNFLGWFEEGAENAFDFKTAITENVELKARWQGDAVMIIYTDYFDGKILQRFNVHYGDPKEAYTFTATDQITDRDGYHYNVNDMWTIPVAETATEDIVYVLKWIKGIAVTFDSDNGEEATVVTVDRDTAVEKPATDPEKEGYTFAGWFEGNNAYDFTALVTGSLYLKAKWTPNKMTVTFDTDGGSAIEAVEVDYDTAVEMPAAPTKDGFVFSGWTLNGEAYDFSKPVTSDIMLTAQWVDAVAKIGDVMYLTLRDAVDAVQNGETIVLLKDTVTVDAENGLTYTIAMNGHTLTGITWVTDDTTLTLDGSVEGSAYNGSIYIGYATNNNGNVTLDGGTYACGAGNTVLHINGTCLNSNVTIRNAKITSPDDNGIQLNGSGEFVIENSEISGATGIYVKSGHLTITNSTITGNMNPANYTYNGNGAVATGDAIVVDSCEYPGGAPVVEIGDGNAFNGTKKQVGYYEFDANRDGETQEGRVTAKTNELTIPEGYAWLKLAENEYLLVKAVAQVEDGYFATFEEAFAVDGVVGGSKIIKLLADGAEYMFRAGDIMKVQLADDDITFVYTADDGVVVTVTGPEEGVTTYTATTAVAKIGDVLYAKLADAVSAVQNDETIELLQNVSEDLLIGGGKSFTLDLCEHTMTGSIDQYDADVTINNGTIAGTIYANGLEDGKNGKLTIEADAKVVAAEHAIILWQADDNTGNGFTIDINGTVNGIAWVMGNITTGNSVINVNNGATITGDDVGIALNGCATVNVNDGATVTGTGTGIEVRAGELNVTGGTITGSGTATEVEPNGSGTTTSGAGIAIAQHTTGLDVSVNVSGGTITGTTALNIANPQSNSDGAITVAVTGGIFNGPVNVDETETRVEKFVSGGDFIETVEPGYVVEGKLCTTTLTETINGTPYYYIVNAVTVTFDANEGQFPAAEGEEPKAIIEVVIPAGEKVVAAETPTREPYHFEGWFEENAAAAFDFENTAITADLTLKAKWHVDMYTVTVTSSGNGQPIAGATVANVTGGGSYALGAKITVSAPTVSGYTFLGWYVLNGDKLSDQQDYEYTVLAEGNNLIAVYTPVGGATFRLTVTGSKFTVSGINATQRSYFDRKLAVNGSITVTFTGNEKFLYWINSSNKIVSRSPAYTFMLVQDTDLTAVYSEADTAEALIVFVSAKVDGQVMSSFYATASDPIEFPMAPSSMGKTFKCWSIDGTNEATADVIHNAIASAQDGRIEVYPVYESTGKTYDVTVVCVDENGNEISSETPFTGVAVGSSSNVTAEATLDGKAFSFWADGVGEDRTILAYTLTYNVRPVENITLYAVYGAEADARPTIVMSQAYASMNGAKYRVSFTTTRSVPEGYTVESVGQLYVRGEYLDTTNDETIMQALVLNSENGNVKNVKTSNIESNSTHTLNINTSEMNRVFYARGYLVVNGPNGVETIYTDTYLFGSYNTLPNIDQ